MSQPLTKEHLLRMKIPKLYWHVKLSEIPDECPHKKHLVRYMANLRSNLAEGKGLLLQGEYGVGKTAIGCILLKATASVGKTGLFVRSGEIIKAILDKTQFDEETTLAERLVQVDLLVIDELIVGTESKFEFFVEDVVRERISQQKVNIITTNQSKKQLADKYPALTAALLESVYPLQVKGHNFRRAIANDLNSEYEDLDR